MKTIPKETIKPQIGLKFNYGLGTYIITNIDIKRQLVFVKETSGDYQLKVKWNYTGLLVYLTNNPKEIQK